MSLTENTPENEVVEMLPPTWKRIASIIPVTDVLKIIEAFGGTQLYIPSDRKRSANLEGVIGRTSVEKLSKIYGGDNIYVTSGARLRYSARKKMISSLRKKGWTVSRIARHLNVSERTVYSHIAKES